LSCFDLSWSYSPSLDNFIWHHGSSATDESVALSESFYPSVKGVPMLQALPNPRAFSGGGVDSQGRCWLIGGMTADLAGMENFADV
jgi:hypothetical protein